MTPKSGKKKPGNGEDVPVSPSESSRLSRSNSSVSPAAASSPPPKPATPTSVSSESKNTESKNTEKDNNDAPEDDDKDEPFLTRLVKWRVADPNFYTQDDPMTLELQAKDVTVRPISDVLMHTTF